MMLRNAIEEAEERLIALDEGSQELFEPYAELFQVPAVDLASKLGDQPQLRTIAGLVLAAGVALDDDRMVRAGARMMIAHEGATAIKSVLKHRVDRTRPRSAEDRDDKKPRKGDSRAKELSSFPSGHSAGAIAVARAFSREYPEYGGAALAAAGVIAALQVPRSAHYLSDVVAGLMIGIGAEAASNAVWNLTGMDDRSRGED